MNEIKYISKERIWTEFSKGLLGAKPSEMIKFLIETGAWKQITNSSISIEAALNKVNHLKILKLLRPALKWPNVTLITEAFTRKILHKNGKAFGVEYPATLPVEVISSKLSSSRSSSVSFLTNSLNNFFVFISTFLQLF